MPTLIVMRHAKAVPHRAEDFSRELEPRGVNDAVAVGKWLARDGWTPDRALASPAARTRQTWEHAAAAAGWSDTTVEYLAPLYEAEVEDWLQAIREVPEDTGTLICVGHNPAIGQLAQQNDFPTSAADVFAVDAWPTLAPSGLHRLSALRP